MKRILFVMLILAGAVLLCGCSGEVESEDIVRDFVYSYGAEGVIYSPNKMSHQEGYISDGLMEKVFVSGNKLPDNFAVLLNNKSTRGFEVGAFICESENERASVSEMCYERIDLLTEDAGEGLLIRSGNLVIYTTAADRDRAEKIIRKIIRAYY